MCKDSLEQLLQIFGPSVKRLFHLKRMFIVMNILCEWKDVWRLDQEFETTSFVHRSWHSGDETNYSLLIITVAADRQSNPLANCTDVQEGSTSLITLNFTVNWCEPEGSPFSQLNGRTNERCLYLSVPGSNPPSPETFSDGSRGNVLMNL